MKSSLTEAGLALVRAERTRQDELWGVQDHSPERWLAILGEEFGEVAKEVAMPADGKPFDAHAYVEELVQVAAVAIAAAESLARQELHKAGIDVE